MADSIRQPRGELTRTGILSVARRLFSEFGYHNTGIADIQAATGLTKGAFYHHFRAKQELALAIVDVLESDYERELFEPAMTQATPGRRVAALLDRAVLLGNRPEWCNGRLLVMLFAEVGAADGVLAERVQNLQAQVLAQVARMVQAAQDSEEAVPGPADVWAQLILSVLLGLVLIDKTGAVQAESHEVLATIKRTLLSDGVAAMVPEPALPKVVHLPEDAEYF